MKRHWLTAKGTEKNQLVQFPAEDIVVHMHVRQADLLSAGVLPHEGGPVVHCAVDSEYCEVFYMRGGVLVIVDEGTGVGEEL